MNRAEIEAVIDLAWQARHGGGGNIHAAISKLRALADDAPQEMPTAMNARWHDAPEDKSWRYAVRQAIADNGSVPRPDDDADTAVAHLLDVARKAVMFEAVNSVYQPPGLAELICRHKLWVTARIDGLVAGGSSGRRLEEYFNPNDPASLRAAIERLVGRIEK